MEPEFGRVSELLESYREDMARCMSDMVCIRAISPASGGEGESKRAAFLQALLEGWGFGVRRFSYKDESGTERPNLVASLGNVERKVWLVAHMDTVSEGDPSLWESDPFTARIENGRIYGRGTCDNGQDLIAGLYALRALSVSKINLRYGIGLALVADEELGSAYGIQKLLDENIFKEKDMFVVPDYGKSSGDVIEIAEKGLLWLKISVNGQQVHASTPDKGKNAYRYSVRLISRLDEELHRKYDLKNGLFDPPTSTFEMTKHEKNVDSVNIIPGKEVFYLDCRLLPEYSIDAVIKDVKAIASESAFGEVSIEVETYVRNDTTEPTSENSEIIGLLSKAIRYISGRDAKSIGIGGGTCAAFFRKRGFPAVVWSRQDEMAHKPNEYSVIENMLNDAKVFAYLCV